jgi:hypothetical protein
MIEMKCPSCGAAGRIPPYKVNVRLVCKKCLKAFHITSTHRAVLGDPPVAKDAPKGKAGYEKTEAIDEMAAKLSSIKLPTVSPRTLGMIVVACLLTGCLYWLFSRQSLETRSNIVANCLVNGEMKTVIDICLQGTETDAIMWYADVAKKYNVLRMSLGEDPGVNIQLPEESKDGASLVIATYSRRGTRIASSELVESLHPVPSRSNSDATMQVPLFWVKDTWGNWVLDGKKTAVGIPGG